jgi:sugar/nucleoside kinase (ribokinase family)
MNESNSPILVRERPTIVGAGLLALDAVLGLDAPRTPSLWAGGTCGNVLSILSFLGWSAWPVGHLKDDPAYRVMAQDWQRWSLRTDLVRLDERGRTPIIVQRTRRTVANGVTHSFSTRCPACRVPFPAHKPLSFALAMDLLQSELPSVRVFFLDRATPGTVALARAFLERGSMIVFEPSKLGNRSQFEELARIASILKFSHERIPAEQLPDVDTPLVIETLGAKGLRYRRRPSRQSKLDCWQRIPAFTVPEVRDTAGCGDWCTAGVIHHLYACEALHLDRMDDADLFNAMQNGQALAALNCRFEGPRGGMYHLDLPTLSELATSFINRASVPVLTTVCDANLPDPDVFRFSDFCNSCLIPA